MPTTTERGYGAEHKRLRARTEREIKQAGGFECWRCGEWFEVGTPWDLGHDDQDRSVYRGAECVPCNRGVASRQTGQEPRRWHTTRALRECVVCGADYRPSYGAQRACGRACGVVLKQRGRAMWVGSRW